MINPNNLTDFSFDFSVVGPSQLIAAIPSKALNVHQLSLSVATTTTVQFLSAAVPLTPPMTINGGVPLVLPFSEHPWLKTAVGIAMGIQLGAAVRCTGHGSYSAMSVYNGMSTLSEEPTTVTPVVPPAPEPEPTPVTPTRPPKPQKPTKPVKPPKPVEEAPANDPAIEGESA